MKILCSLILTVFFCSCNKSEVEAVTPNELNQDEKLIQSCSVNDKWETTYKYNDDSSLKEIVFKTDDVLQYTESFKYENGKIVESLKQKADRSSTVKKQFEYKGNLIVKQIEQTNEESAKTSYFKYNSDNLLTKITTKGSDGSYKYTKITTIEKLAGENKIRVKRTNVADHLISYDEKLTPLCAIPGYKAIVQINNEGITGNILLREVYPASKCTTRIKSELKFDTDGETVLSSEITYEHGDNVDKQEVKYNY